MLFKLVSSTIPPANDTWVPIIDVNGNYFIARWAENGWNYRDLNGPNTPDNNAKIVGWFSPAVLFMQNEIDDIPPVPLNAVEPERYFVDVDNNRNWFLIPEKFRTDWMLWVQKAEDDVNLVPYIHAKPIPDCIDISFAFPQLINKPEPPKKKYPPFPTAEDYGYEEPNLYEEGGWTLEGGEEAYNDAVEKWYQKYRCPECMEIVGSEELVMFGGLCEGCSEQNVEEQ